MTHANCWRAVALNQSSHPAPDRDGRKHADLYSARDDDIPGLVMDGVVDLGIIGENVLEEELLNRRAQGEDPRYFTLRRLDFGGCRLSLATPVDEAWDGPLSLNGKRIATSYPHLLKRYLDQKGISFKSCLLNGSLKSPRVPDWRMRFAIWFPPVPRWKLTACAKSKLSTARKPA